MISLFAGTITPDGWAYSDGSLISIEDNPNLYSLIGTSYGGDGQSQFALPDLRGRAPIGIGQGNGLSDISLGQMIGSPNFLP
ncbi:tail fiber protein [Nisaea acidiphila]|uniref:Tail fiber protein n=1 Tax=Nisaea acidiphila TaxID=1862145 RepID=A0A9J7ASD4_9PROT|nr:tail fiber protein [Nisaea acidiphila]UUX50175.1 tail fiber protein [Nisaea acidiphila]